MWCFGSYWTWKLTCMTHTTCQDGDMTGKFPSPSFSCPLKISLSLHLQTSKVILRCASAALADLRTTLPSSPLSVWVPCHAEKKRNGCLLQKPMAYTLFQSYAHYHIYTQGCVDTHTRTPPLDAAACSGHVRWTGANLSHLTWTTCLNLLKLMFCVDLHWQLMILKKKAWYPALKHLSNPLMLGAGTWRNFHITLGINYYHFHREW